MASELPKTHKCEPCLLDQTECSAVAFCVSCVEYLCKTCTRDHKRNKVTRDHRVLENDDIPKDPSVYKKMKELLSCSKHPTDNLSYKCEEHDQFICVKCLAVEHRKCENVAEITSHTANKTLPEKLEKLRDNALTTINLRKESLASLCSQHKRIEEQRAEFIKSLTDQILQLGEKSKTDTEGRVMKTVTEFEESISKCESIEFDVQSSKELLQIALQFGNETEINVISALVHKSALDLEKESEAQKDKTIRTMQMVFERNLVLKDVDSIGKVSFLDIPETDMKHAKTMLTSSEEIRENTESSDATVQISKEPKAILHDAEKSTLSFMQRKVINCSQHSVRRPSDKQTCNVRGVTILTTGLTVIIDRNNKKIKVFKDYFHFACEQEIEDAPTEICNVSDGVAILSEGCKHVQVFNISKNTVNRCKKWFTRLYCLSIAWRSGWEVFILFSDQPAQTTSSRKILEVEIRDMFDGHIVKTFDVMKHFSEGSLIDFHQLHHTITDGLVISEKDRCHYFEQTKDDFTEKWFYKSHSYKYLDGVSCISSDNEGNVYVCGKNSKNIHQVPYTNYRKSRIIVSSIKDPSVVCVDNRNARLITGRENDDNIHVFHLEN